MAALCRACNRNRRHFCLEERGPGRPFDLRSIRSVHVSEEDSCAHLHSQNGSSGSLAEEILTRQTVCRCQAARGRGYEVTKEAKDRLGMCASCVSRFSFLPELGAHPILWACPNLHNHLWFRPSMQCRLRR
jgi:hypothetical protein